MMSEARSADRRRYRGAGSELVRRLLSRWSASSAGDRRWRGRPRRCVGAMQECGGSWCSGATTTGGGAGAAEGLSTARPSRSSITTYAADVPVGRRIAAAGPVARDLVAAIEVGRNGLAAVREGSAR
jgi:hypothetical protein